ncbi:hypothetical protein JZ751_024469 [Albula glossodonta]|uniref:P-type ATPase C-terminal domain-containing protein n=1 Tax=Albula glossodonta TaxID=121402 RepID=A0A8T2PEQ5_9TELE|nr:hypothetical protein JZ751_024469 [Albula glossodonta]
MVRQDVGAEASLRRPELYHVGQRQELFSPWQLVGTLLYSVYTSLVLFFLPLGVFHICDLDYQSFAVTVETGAIFSVTTEVSVSLNAFRHPLLWLTAFLTACTAILPSLTAHTLSLVLHPHNTHRVHSSGPTTSPRGPLELQSHFRRGDLQRRSSYAMSQGQGFGRLITSGRGLHRTSPPQDMKQTAGETYMDLPHKPDRKDNNDSVTSQ